jgi:hypothetical protein
VREKERVEEEEFERKEGVTIEHVGHRRSEPQTFDVTGKNHYCAAPSPDAVHLPDAASVQSLFKP